MRQWIKTFTSINHNPDMAQLTWAQRGILTALEALAGELDPSHREGSESGKLDTLERTAWRIRCESQLFQEAVDALKNVDLLHEIDGILYVTGYAERQARPPSALPEATRERKRAQRVREKASVDGHEDVTRDTNGSRDVTRSDQIREEKRRSEQREGVTEHGAPLQETGSVSSPPPGAELSDPEKTVSVSHSRFRLFDPNTPYWVALRKRFDKPQTESQRAEATMLKEACEMRIEYEGHPLGREYDTMHEWAQTYGARRVLHVMVQARDSPTHIENLGGWMRTVLRNTESPEVAVGPGSRAPP